MDEVDLFVPMQGGYLLEVEPHVRNVDGCHLTITTALRDACTGALALFEDRNSKMVINADGWGIPRDEGDDAAVGVCPHIGYPHDIGNGPYILQVVANDTSGHHAEVSLTIIPKCTESTCTCNCSASYTLGANCATFPDAGVPPGC
jgi:hypothetical protein